MRRRCGAPRAGARRPRRRLRSAAPPPAPPRPSRRTDRGACPRAAGPRRRAVRSRQGRRRTARSPAVPPAAPQPAPGGVRPAGPGRAGCAPCAGERPASRANRAASWRHGAGARRSEAGAMRPVPGRGRAPLLGFAPAHRAGPPGSMTARRQNRLHGHMAGEVRAGAALGRALPAIALPCEVADRGERFVRPGAVIEAGNSGSAGEIFRSGVGAVLRGKHAPLEVGRRTGPASGMLATIHDLRSTIHDPRSAVGRAARPGGRTLPGMAPCRAMRSTIRPAAGPGPPRPAASASDRCSRSARGRPGSRDHLPHVRDPEAPPVSSGDGAVRQARDPPIGREKRVRRRCLRHGGAGGDHRAATSGWGRRGRAGRVVPGVRSAAVVGGDAGDAPGALLRRAGRHRPRRPTPGTRSRTPASRRTRRGRRRRVGVRTAIVPPGDPRRARPGGERAGRRLSGGARTHRPVHAITDPTTPRRSSATSSRRASSVRQAPRKGCARGRADRRPGPRTDRRDDACGDGPGTGGPAGAASAGVRIGRSDADRVPRGRRDRRGPRRPDAGPMIAPPARPGARSIGSARPAPDTPGPDSRRAIRGRAAGATRARDGALRDPRPRARRQRADPSRGDDGCLAARRRPACGRGPGPRRRTAPDPASGGGRPASGAARLDRTHPAAGGPGRPPGAVAHGPAGRPERPVAVPRRRPLRSRTRGAAPARSGSVAVAPRARTQCGRPEGRLAARHGAPRDRGRSRTRRRPDRPCSAVLGHSDRRRLRSRPRLGRVVPPDAVPGRYRVGRGRQSERACMPLPRRDIPGPGRAGDPDAVDAAADGNGSRFPAPHRTARDRDAELRRTPSAARSAGGDEAGPSARFARPLAMGRATRRSGPARWRRPAKPSGVPGPTASPPIPVAPPGACGLARPRRHP